MRLLVTYTPYKSFYILTTVINSLDRRVFNKKFLNKYNRSYEKLLKTLHIVRDQAYSYYESLGKPGLVFTRWEDLHNVYNRTNAIYTVNCKIHSAKVNQLFWDLVGLFISLYIGLWLNTLIDYYYFLPYSLLNSVLCLFVDFCLVWLIIIFRSGYNGERLMQLTRYIYSLLIFSLLSIILLLITVQDKSNKIYFMLPIILPLFYLSLKLINEICEVISYRDTTKVVAKGKIGIYFDRINNHIIRNRNKYIIGIIIIALLLHIILNLYSRRNHYYYYYDYSNDSQVHHSINIPSSVIDNDPDLVQSAQQSEAGGINVVDISTLGTASQPEQ